MTSNAQDNPFIGKWRITEMENFDQDMVEMGGPAIFHIHEERKGYLEFLGMKVDVDLEISVRDEQPFAEFTWWEPHRLPHCGRGWIKVEGNSLIGKIYFHGGDRSEFKSEKFIVDPDEDAITALLRRGPIPADPDCFRKYQELQKRKPNKGSKAKSQKRIPDKVKTMLQKRLEQHISEKWSHTLVKLDLRFKSTFAYVDVKDPTENFPTHLCRLGYQGDADNWTFAFYKYSDDVYEKSRDWEGSFITTPEKAFDVAATVYLTGN